MADATTTKNPARKWKMKTVHTLTQIEYDIIKSNYNYAKRHQNNRQALLWSGFFIGCIFMFIIMRLYIIINL